MLLSVREITKSFGGELVLRGVSFDLDAGEIVALLGPSGCGKTTLLRIIAGLESADTGELSLEGEDLQRIPVHQRGFGMVFQDYALFPHKRVAENIGFGLRMHGWKSEERDERVSQVMDLVGLGNFGARQVFDLSGGEQQRVALARALAPSPRLLLLDEPLGALDRALRERLMGELRPILKRAGQFIGSGPTTEAGITTIYVTHDQEEAFSVADRILIMNHGAFEQIGTPAQLYHYPRNAFVARFLGMENLIPATIISQDPPRVSTPLGTLHYSGDFPDVSGEADLLIRPDAGQLVPPEANGDNIISGIMGDVSFRGRHLMSTINCRTEDASLVLKLAFDSALTLPPMGTHFSLRLDPEELQVLPAYAR